MWISPLMAKELRRIVEESEIVRCVALWGKLGLTASEDDARWPKRNAVGRQELEVRLGRDHISFEVGSALAVRG